MTSYISPSITDPALRDTLQSIADDVDASGITISDVDPDASLTARSGRLWYNATSSNLFIFSDAQGGYVRATGEEKSYHSVRIYYVVDLLNLFVPSAPQVTLTWANLTQASAGAQYKGGLVLTSGSNPNISSNTGNGMWVENPPAVFNDNTKQVFWSDLTFQRESGSATTTTTGTTPVKHIHIDGLVTFTNQSIVGQGQTTIDGGKITTGTLNADRIVAGSIQTDKMALNSVSIIQSATSSAITPGSTFNSIFSGLGSNSFSCTALSVVTVYGTATSSTSVTVTGTFSGASFSAATALGHGIIAGGSAGLGTHVLAGSASNILAAGGNAFMGTTFSASSLGASPNGSAAQAKITHVYAAYYR